MPTLKELIKAKVSRLESVPDAFVSEVQRIQIELLKEIIVLLARFDIDDDGSFVISEGNMAIAAQMDVMLRQTLDASEYPSAVTEFAKQFNSQIAYNDAYFSAAFKGFESSEIGAMMVRSAQKTAVELLINTSADANFILPLKQQIEQAVINGARFKETLKAIQEIVTGNEEVDGKILSYSKQISHDTFAVADRSYGAAVANQVGANWFLYSGGEIKSTRPFCEERFNQYFCRKEIELWGAGTKTEGFAWPQDGGWAGEMKGTDAQTIFSTAGGYNCQHSIVAVSIFDVPVDDVQRAVRLGYYEPTDFEEQELGL